MARGEGQFASELRPVAIQPAMPATCPRSGHGGFGTVQGPADPHMRLDKDTTASSAASRYSGTAPPCAAGHGTFTPIRTRSLRSLRTRVPRHWGGWLDRWRLRLCAAMADLDATAMASSNRFPVAKYRSPAGTHPGDPPAMRARGTLLRATRRPGHVEGAGTPPSPDIPPASARPVSSTSRLPAP